MPNPASHGHNKVGVTLNRVAVQPVLFAEKPARLALHEIAIDAAVNASVTINVWRNHAIEPLLELAMPYCAYGGWRADFVLSAYDDALGFLDHQSADIELLWLDSSRYLAHTPFEVWLEWLGSRIRYLRAATGAPIVLACWVERTEQMAALQALADAVPGVYFADLAATCAEAGVALTDPRSSAATGTPIGKAAQPLLARKLACHWLPASLFPPIKAVVLDLDHTLHAGVLGEDGIDGVVLTPAHRDLQEFLKALRERGIFIALLSRNESSDVEALFARRADYPLHWGDFSAAEVSWGDKAGGLLRIAEALRIAPDAMVFVDDNPGELASVAVQLPDLHMVHAHVDAALTRRALEYFPGLWRWRIEADDGKRVRDLAAHAERVALQENLPDAAEYLRSLEVVLTYRNDPADQLERLADLCRKTNQFNLALRRFTPAEVAERMARTDACTAGVHLSDRLSDSGVVAVIVAELAGERLLIEELCISCRALGRQLEDTMIFMAIRGMPIFAQCREVSFRARSGPRNQPALAWLARQQGRSEAGSALVSLTADWVRTFAPADGITLIHL